MVITNGKFGISKEKPQRIWVEYNNFFGLYVRDKVGGKKVKKILRIEHFEENKIRVFCEVE